MAEHISTWTFRAVGVDEMERIRQSARALGLELQAVETETGKFQGTLRQVVPAARSLSGACQKTLSSLRSSRIASASSSA